MKIIHLLVLILLGTSCRQTLDYNSKPYQNAIEHFENENYDSTRMILLTAARTFKLPDTALHYLAICYHLKNDRDSAIYYWKKVTTQNPEFELGFYNLGLMYDYNEDNVQAIQNYDKAINIDPKSKKALFNKASILFEQGQYLESTGLCHRAIASDSTYILPYYLLGRIYLETNKQDSSLIYNRLLVQLDSVNPEYLFYLAQSESSTGNYEQAIRLYSKSLEINPSGNQIIFNRATLYQEIQEYELAKQDYWDLLKLDSADVECYTRLSWIYSKQNKLDSMRLVLETSIHIDPTYSNAYLYLGDYYHRTNKKYRACELYQKAAELNNQSAIDRLTKRCNNGENKSS